ncbi:hypothetical protein AMAG_06005 [Allomyces macrogynus ATCC 38327]|uniref:Uncharacterized protein n=1 Tax=Allomyces macrogynus (strain ATCC 38327) TaxID=578462 RepID=A0A0L0SDX4_ALLM3|nr:hypothetical protein AMAG_06005 [Allomyces macrogynus ATCC 38327]|eukprot:KNE60629.1 hypothetical protein AMAG_06005 [Allomyces macrogynus ATCC 38327]
MSPPSHAHPLAYLLVGGLFPVLTYVSHAPTVPPSLAWIPRETAQQLWWGVILLHLAEAAVATVITANRRYRAADVAKWFIGVLIMGGFVLNQLFLGPQPTTTGRPVKAAVAPASSAGAAKQGKKGKKKAQ